MKKLLYSLLLVSAALVLQVSCSKDDPEPPKNTATDILTFAFTEETGAATINSTNHTIAVEVANGTDLTNLSPTFTVSTGATASPSSGTSGDYSSAVTVTVTAEDGTTTQNWTVNVTEEGDSGTDILSFTMPGQTSTAVINSSDHTVTVEVGEGTNVTSLAPTFTISEGATADPESYTEGDYTSPVIITVTAEDETTSQDWTVIVTVMNGPSNATDILTFSLPGQIGDPIINNDVHIVLIKVAAGTNLTSLTPTFTLSAGATSDPASGTADDYSSAVTIAVTAGDGTTTQDWVAKVLVEGVESSENDILSFTLPQQTKLASISVQTHTVAIEVESGTLLTNLTPTWSLSEGATSAPVSGTSGDYSSEVTITVTAEDGTAQDWTVNVSEGDLVSNATDILSFSYSHEYEPAVIDGGNHTIDLVVKYGQDLTKIYPSWTMSDGATSEPLSGGFHDYSSPFPIIVTAEDGTTTQEWTVNASVAGPINDATDILSFNIIEKTGDAIINNTAHTITIEVANGTDLTALTPIWTLSDAATSSPVSGTTSDYSSEFTITVTAQDGTTTQDWAVNVTEAPPEPPNDAAKILAFSLDEQTSLADINHAALTVDIEVVNGTVLTDLTPTFLLSIGATSNPESGTAGDYSSPVIITVTAEDGIAIQEYTVTVTEASAGISSETDILTFEAPGQTKPAVIDAVDHKIYVEVPDGTYLYQYEATWTLSPGATSTPVSGAPYTYVNPTVITVIAEDGTTMQQWTVYVEEAEE